MRSILTHAARARKAAIESGDANRILLHFKRSVAVALYYNGMNVMSAGWMPESELLTLKGIGPKSVEAIQMAINTAGLGGKHGPKFTE